MKSNLIINWALWGWLLLLTAGCDTGVLVDNRQVPVIKLADEDLLNIVKASPTPFPPVPPDTYTIESVAGQVGAGFGGDDGPARTARFSYPSGLALDSKGNLYVADRNNNRVRKIDSKGNVSTVAGGGQEIKEGRATEVRLVRPVDVEVDSKDRLYILEEIGQQIYRMEPDGMLKRVVGGNSKSQMVDFELFPQPALQAFLKEPLGLAMDPKDNLYIADTVNSMIRQVDSTGTIRTVAGRGNGSAQFSGDGLLATGSEMAYPSGVAVSPTGEIAVADRFNHRVRQIGTTGIMQTVAGNLNLGYNGEDLPAAESSLLEPYAVAYDKDGNLLFTEIGTQLVRKINKQGRLKTIAGCPGGTCLEQISADMVLQRRGSALKQGIAVKISAPKGLAVSSKGEIYFSEGNRIQKLVLIEARPDELAPINP